MKSQKRLFVAVPFSEETVKKIESVQSGWKQSLESVKSNPVPRLDFHLTLHFLGNTFEEQIPLLESFLEKLNRTARFNYALNRFLAFPDLKRAKVLALSGAIGISPLSHLYSQMKESLLKMGKEVEERVYVPHVTLFRLKESLLSSPLEIEEEINVCVDRYALYESRLTSLGSQYHVLNQWELK
jgi:2'-5' RNA ligase